MKAYPYIDTTRANADGSFPVYIIIKNARGRFFVNTGITTTGKLDGREFPRSDRQARQKSLLLGRYLADVEAVCLRSEIADLDNAALKAAIQSEVFGVEKAQRTATLGSFIRKFAETKLDATKDIYLRTADKVDAFGAVVPDKADAAWLESFRQHCMDGGMSVNGAGKEMRNIRAVFNWARRQGMTHSYPFLDYRIPSAETVPNNISVDDLRRLRDYPCETWQKPYVDFFMLSFYLAGINPVDLLSLKKGDLRDGHISFVRKKTDKQGASSVRTVVVPVVRQAQEIIDRYPSREGWLLGFMDRRSTYRSFARECNDALKKVGPSHKVPDKVGKLRKMEYSPVCPDITLYSARYTFGSIAANDLDISERTIGMCLGHSWARNVTSRYMSADQKKVDNAVRMVVDYVENG